MLKKTRLQKNYNYKSFFMSQDFKINKCRVSKTPERNNYTNMLKNYSQKLNTSPKLSGHSKQSHKRTIFSSLKFDCKDEPLNIINLYINGIKDLKLNDTLSYTIKLMKLHSYLQKFGHSYKIISNFDLNKYITQNSIQLLANDKHILKNIQIKTLHHIYMLYLFNALYKFKKFQTFRKFQGNSQELKIFLEELINNEKCKTSPTNTKNCVTCEIIKKIFNTNTIRNKNNNNTNNFNYLSVFNDNNKNEHNTTKKYNIQTQIINHNKKIHQIKQKLINKFNNINKINNTYYPNLEKNLTLSPKKNTASLTNKTKRIIKIKIKNSTIINGTFKEDKEKQQNIKTEPNNSFIKYLKKEDVNGANYYKINHNCDIFDCHKSKVCSKSNSVEQSISKKNKRLYYNNCVNNKTKSKIFIKNQVLYPNSIQKRNDNLGTFKDFITLQKIQKMINGNIFINYNISTIFKDSSKKEHSNKSTYNKEIRKANSNRNSFLFNTNIKMANIDKTFNKKVYETNKCNKNNNKNVEVNKEFKYDDNYFVINKHSKVQTCNISNGENKNNNNDMPDINIYTNEIENRINYMKEEINMFKAHNNEIKKQLYNLNNKNNKIYN